MKESLKVLSNIDYAELKVQKQHLIELAGSMMSDDPITLALDGVTNLIDNIQDAIVKDGFRTEEEVFNMEDDGGGESWEVKFQGLKVKINDIDDEVEYANYYHCPNCDNEWEDVWTAMCDDECGYCGHKNISPYKSEEVK
jgi:DNA-directed RNA polymerase subunit RPC12/RpoP